MSSLTSLFTSSKEDKEKDDAKMLKILRDHHINSFNENAKEKGIDVKASATDGKEKINGMTVDIIIKRSDGEVRAKYHVKGWSADAGDDDQGELVCLWRAPDSK